MAAPVPRDYQANAIRECLALLPSKKVILVSPTGSGKTFMAAEIVKALGVPTLALVHRREIVVQSAQAIERMGISTGLILAGHEPTPGAFCQVGSVQTLARRSLPHAELIWIDEAHHAVADSYREILAQYPRAMVLATTATPFRTDGVGLGDVGFQEIVVAAHSAQLCANGTLVEPSVFAPDIPDLSHVAVKRGDFNEDEASAVMNTRRLVGNVVETWKKRAFGRRTVVFAVDVAHSKSIRDRFIEAGVRAEHLDGETPVGERHQILARLASGATTVLCNCMVLTEGWDMPALEVAVIARPTASLLLHLQRIGRIMRACLLKSGALVLDHAGDVFRHGLVTDRLEYSLTGVVKKASKATGTKTCPDCTAIVPLSTTTCPECGHAFRVTAASVTEVEGELKPIPSASQDDFTTRALFFRRIYTIGLRMEEKATRTEPEPVPDALFPVEAPKAKRRVSPETMASAAYFKRYGSYPMVLDGHVVDPGKVGKEDLEKLRAGWLKTGAAIAERKKKTDVAGFVRWFLREKETEFRRGVLRAATKVGA